MLALPTSVSIFLYSQPCDMRKSFDGLSGIVRGELGREPDGQSLFLFINRRRDRIKALWWDTDGLVLFYKRLESGTFQHLRADAQSDIPAVRIDSTELAMILGGVALESARRRKRFTRGS
jgi:transposase